MRVEFRIQDERKRICRWDAVRGKRTRTPGSVMGYGARQQWRELGTGEALVFEWPSPTGHIERVTDEDASEVRGARGSGLRSR